VVVTVLIALVEKLQPLLIQAEVVELVQTTLLPLEMAVLV
jgi:hypothetical protein